MSYTSEDVRRLIAPEVLASLAGQGISAEDMALSMNRHAGAFITPAQAAKLAELYEESDPDIVEHALVGVHGPGSTEAQRAWVHDRPARLAAEAELDRVERQKKMAKDRAADLERDNERLRASLATARQNEAIALNRNKDKS